MIGVPIDMPKACAECPFRANDAWCEITDSEFAEDFFDMRLPDCPLVDLQKPPEAVEAEKAIERMRGNLNRIREVLKVLNE